jgi:predicted nucleic acid-binding protein
MNKAYLDPNFLASLFIPGHEFQQKAMVLFATLRTQKYNLYISSLVLDELWLAIYKDLNQQGKIKRGPIDMYEDIKKSWEAIKKYAFIKLIQTKKPIGAGVENAIRYLKKHNLRPRDSFHLAIAESHKICEIITYDSDFTDIQKKVSQSGFKIIN